MYLGRGDPLVRMIQAGVAIVIEKEVLQQFWLTIAVFLELGWKSKITMAKKLAM